MSDTHTYIITEHDFDAALLQKIFPKEALTNVKIVSAGGYTSAISLARSLLYTPGKYAILALDARSNEEVEILDRYYFLREYMRMGAPENRFKIFLFKPEIERIFFENKAVLEEITGRQVSDMELELAALQPRLGLSKLSGMSTKELGNGVLLRRLSDDIIAQLRKSPVIKELLQHIAQSALLS